MTRSLLLVAFAALAAAQTREKRIVPIDAAQAQAFTQQRKAGVAILVGVGKYPRYSGLSELRYPSRDVDLLEKALESQRYVVVPLKESEATKGAVLNAIQQAGEVVDRAGGTIVFFFSGHGFADSDTNFLATFDAASNNLSQSGLSLTVVEKALAATGAARRVLWVDACRNEPGKAVGGARSFARFNASAGSRVLFSTKAGRVSYEDDELQQGLFSHFLVRGLRGEAARADGLVSFRDLADFVADGVQTRSLKQGRVQVPYEAGEASGDFLLARTEAVVEAVPVNAPRINPKDGLKYVWIPPGSFQMGCSPGDNGCGDGERPAHKVHISRGFYLGQTEVTQAAYQRLMGTNPSHFKGSNLPVESVGHEEAVKYCSAIGGRLPTEAEWEYAARGGVEAVRYGELDEVAWYDGNSGSKTHPVGTKKPNSYGLYDMLGNVYEWISDWFGLYSGASQTDPIGSKTGIGKVLRGGGWNIDKSYVRSSGRAFDRPGGGVDVGFRCLWE